MKELSLLVLKNELLHSFKPVILIQKNKKKMVKNKKAETKKAKVITNNFYCH